MGHLRYIFCTMASALALQAPAQAQERRLALDFTALLLYDSNFARSSEAQAIARGIEPEELRFSPALTIDAEIPVGRHSFFVSALAGYDFHVNNPRFDRERLQGRAGLRAWLGRCTSTIEGRIARRQTELDDIVIGPVDNAETVKEAILGAECAQVLAGLVPSFEFSGRWTDNSNLTRQTTDSDTRRGIGRLAYVQPSFGQIGVFGELLQTDYPNRVVAAAFGGFATDEFEARTVGVSYARNIGAALRGIVSAGYTEVDTRSLNDAFDGLTWSARLFLNPEGRLRPTLIAERSVQSSNRIGVSFLLEELYRAEFTYLLSGRVTLNGRVSLRDRQYQPVAGALGQPLTDEQTGQAAAGLSYRVSQRLSLELELLRENRDTNDPLFDYSSTRIGLSTRTTF